MEIVKKGFLFPVLFECSKVSRFSLQNMKKLFATCKYLKRFSKQSWIIKKKPEEGDKKKMFAHQKKKK